MGKKATQKGMTPKEQSQKLHMKTKIISHRRTTTRRAYRYAKC